MTDGKLANLYHNVIAADLINSTVVRFEIIAAVIMEITIV